jgi:hypothetical protein
MAKTMDLKADGLLQWQQKGCLKFPKKEYENVGNYWMKLYQ